jgi:tRNA U34 5-methylaminomethyl-2-thiouridine-forming methyltransferase MnmC
VACDQRQSAEITWRDEMVPVSARFDDPYFSIADGLAETRHVFLHGNQLPEGFRPGFHIGELGFGTGLNMLCAWQSWRQAGQPGALKYTSFEAYPMAAPDIAQALNAFPELADLAQEFLAIWQTGTTRFSLPGLEAKVVLGDARLTLPQVSDRMGAWFLDGFAPAKNPELWEAGLMAEIAAHTKPGGRFATYTAAGHVRRSLAEVGFVVDRVAGFGRKRHMTTGYLKDQP